MQDFHRDPTLNFSLNRLARCVDAGQVESLASSVADIDGFVVRALVAGQKAESSGRQGEAAYFYRAAEFFMAPEHPQKAEAYERFMYLFYAVNPVVAEWRTTVPYGGGELGVIDLPANGVPRDTIVACSGFDGLIEEMVPAMRQFAAEGYRVLLFEGPGQGAALRRSKLTMVAEWEEPVRTVLDHFAIGTCSILGLSLGGYLAPRAAAFESRAKRLIVWGPMHDFLDCFRPRMGEAAFAALKSLIDAKERDQVNQLLQSIMASNVTARWSITHGMHTSGTTSPYDFLAWAATLNLRDVSDLIDQDVLIMAGSDDHLVPSEHPWWQASALRNARSVSVRVFTGAEDAGEHCQVTKPRIAVTEACDWLARLDRQRNG